MIPQNKRASGTPTLVALEIRRKNFIPSLIFNIVHSPKSLLGNSLRERHPMLPHY